MIADRSRLPAAGAAASVRLPAIHKTRLPNGLAVWTVEHRNVPVVCCLLVVPAGSAQDPPGLDGLASLAGDMLDEGTGDLSALGVSDRLARLGAQFETEIGVDATLVALTTLSHSLARGLALLADMTVRPRLAAEDFDRVRRLRLHRLTQLRDLPPFLAERAFARWIYGSHPYGHMPLGAEPTLQRMTVDDVRRYHRRVFVPDGSTLIVVGDGTHDALAAAVAEAFGGWQATGDGHVPVDLPEPPDRLPSGRVALVNRTGAAQSELRIGQVAVARDTPDYHALLVLNTVLGGQFISRINMNLRQAKGFTYGARTVFDFRRHRGPFVFLTSVKSSVTGEALREAMAEIEAIRGGRPATPEEVRTAAAALTLGYGRNFETAPQVAQALSQLALYGLPDDYFEQFVPRVVAVTAPEVLRVAQQHLDPDRMALLVVGDRAVVEPALAALPYGAPTILPAD